MKINGMLFTTGDKDKTIYLATIDNTNKIFPIKVLWFNCNRTDYAPYSKEKFIKHFETYDWKILGYMEDIQEKVL